MKKLLLKMMKFSLCGKQLKDVRKIERRKLVINQTIMFERAN